MMPSEPIRRFHFLREIGSGAFGAVYQARLMQPDGFSRMVAVKLLHAKWSEHDEAARRLRDEARLLGRLRHRNIVEVVDLTRIDGRAAVVMELLEAVDLRVIVGAASEIGVPVPVRVGSETCAAAASALDAAYNRPPLGSDKPLRVVHRDIKPSNIMLTREGVVKVLDFGVARAEFSERESKTQEVTFGSVDFMAPERLFREPDGPAGDVYALGATFFELLAGKRFGKARLRHTEQEAHVEARFEALVAARPFADKGVEDLVHDLLYDMLAFGAADRPSASEVVTRLRAISKRLPEEEGVEGWAEVVVPTLIGLTATATAGRPGGSLAERMFTEDSFSSRGGASEIPTSGPVSVSEAPPVPRNNRIGERGHPPPLVTPSRAPPTLNVDAMPLSFSDFPGPGADDEEAATVVRQFPSFDEPEEAVPSGPSLMPMVIGAVVVVLVMGGVGVIGLGLGAMLWFGVGQQVTPEAVDAVAVEAEEVENPVEGVAAVEPMPIDPSPGDEPAAEPEVPAVVEAAPSGPTFVSHLPGTTRFAVRCAGGNAVGDNSATVPSLSPGDCTITAVGAGHQRMVTVLKSAKIATYACFADAKEACEIVEH